MTKVQSVILIVPDQNTGTSDTKLPSHHLSPKSRRISTDHFHKLMNSEMSLVRYYRYIQQLPKVLLLGKHFNVSSQRAKELIMQIKSQLTPSMPQVG